MNRERWGNVGLVVLAVVTVAAVVLTFLKMERATAEPATALPAPTASSAATRPRAVFLGDAYTTGTGSDGTRWTTLVAERMGWDEVNLGHDGTGYVTSVTGDLAKKYCGLDRCPSYGETVDDVVAAKPDIVVVSGGRVDGTRKVSSAAAALFADLSSKVPAARVIVVAPFFDDDPVPAWLTAQASALEAAAAEAGVDYIDAGQPLTGHSELLSGDGVRPNAQGHGALADAVAEKLGD
ncbi:SGNH/GDSL hydrolase family protein [Raineyella sp. LH-20]|uniref:SGNH/GDSL hydrolase family protein n=1 Tax=Raineyella sp. LH-20 TaxID=3081204 RepID=UPI002953E80D|nr:SGNH/GDSL hydrolase family protein [Raineyella sp. LH-20]WOP17570.1 SGNH/GDSL hydrolase family protein [Raineyella sp. LH-20]